jgi:4'-phosphopantetheinyl transferase
LTARPTGFAAKRPNVGFDISGVWDASTDAAKVQYLPAGVVHLWKKCFDASPEGMERSYEMLSPEERARAERFLVEPPRRAFILTRGTLRLLLGKYLDRAPSEISFRYTEFGKPLLDQSNELRFNVSHTDGVALLAFVRGRELGVDVEKIRPVKDLKDLANRFFSQAERKKLNGIEGEHRLRGAFFRCWTRKEAYIKGKGEGLSIPLHQFDVSLEMGETQALIATRPEASEAGRWLVRDISFDPSYVAALAIEVASAANSANLKSRG